MTEHTITPKPETLHGYYSREIAPVLTIQSGDRVTYQLIDAGWRTFDNPNGFEPAPRFERDADKHPEHAMHGPLYINGAKAGMTLEIRLLEIIPGDWGWAGAGGRPAFNEKYDLEAGAQEIIWRIADDKQTAVNAAGQVIKLSPFLGNIGMPPPEAGEHSTTPPRWCGGNIDCKAITTGSSLFLPIPVDGGLLSLGDGHAVQGDGEVAGPALECPMERIVAEFHLRPEMNLKVPRANTPQGWITFGFDENIETAMDAALYDMVTLISEQYKVTRKEAYSLASLTADLHITQIVNGVRGVHMILPHNAIENPSK